MELASQQSRRPCRGPSEAMRGDDQAEILGACSFILALVNVYLQACIAQPGDDFADVGTVVLLVARVD